MTDLSPLDDIGRSILVLRGHRMILDSALAALYGVPTHRFNEQVKRNLARFPTDFMFTVTAGEFEKLTGLPSRQRILYPTGEREGRSLV